MTSRVIPMPNHRRTVADLQATRATLTQAKECIAELVAAVHDIAPDHEVLTRLAPFIQPNEPQTDTRP